MKKADLHPKEESRISALQKTGLLDSEAQEEYDSIALLASYICGTPIALISLVDGDRQWFKSKIGLEVDQTSRDYAFCSHAILHDDVFVVEDSRLDSRFIDNPLVTAGPKVIFYAGAPLLEPETKLPLGTICVIDHIPRSLTSEQKSALNNLSKQVSKLIELRQKIKKAEQQNKKLLQASVAIENMQEGFVIQDKDGQITDFNSSALRILCMNEEQILGKSSVDPSWKAIKADGTVFPGEEHPAMVALKTGKPQSGIKMGIRSNQNKETWISINSSPIFSSETDKPISVVTTFMDITDLEIAQVKLLHNARLASVAQMAGGIAHEINNPMAAINAICNSCLKMIETNQVDSKIIETKLLKIRSMIFRISRIIKGLQSFSRTSNEISNSVVNFSEVLSDVLSICTERFAKREIPLQIEVPDKVLVQADFIKLGQVILNLLNNSFDAIYDSSDQDKWVKVEVEFLDTKTQISVTDSGKGINADLVSKMFLPFFTTKDVGKGTGLGLSISKGLIEEMNGRLYFDSESNNTKFVIELHSAYTQESSQAS